MGDKKPVEKSVWQTIQDNLEASVKAPPEPRTLSDEERAAERVRLSPKDDKSRPLMRGMGFDSTK